MPAPTISYRTTGIWGVGIGRNLTPTEVDVNFYNIHQSIQDLIDNPLAPVEISDISVTNNFLTITLSDYSTFGPFQLPIATFRDRGAWAAVTVYNYADIFTEGTGLYMVLQDHTSGGTFNAAAGNMAGPYYRLLFSADNLMISWQDQWQPLIVYGAFDLFSVPDVGVFLVLKAHTSAATFDPLAVDDDNNALYLKVFQSIESEIARLQFQFPGTISGSGGVMWKIIQDDDRNLIFNDGFPNCSAHLEVAVTAAMVFSIAYAGDEVGTITFSPGDLLDGDGGQFGTFAGDGATIANLELLRVLFPGVADATASFLTVSLIGTYVDAS